MYYTGIRMIIFCPAENAKSCFDKLKETKKCNFGINIPTNI